MGKIHRVPQKGERMLRTRVAMRRNLCPPARAEMFARHFVRSNGSSARAHLLQPQPPPPPRASFWGRVERARSSVANIWPANLRANSGGCTQPVVSQAKG